MSGSTAAEDIAKRRRLEAELLEAKEGLNDTYYSNAKDSQMNALDEEAKAYEDTMNRYVEGLRDTLKTATEDMSAFVNTIAGNVVANADVVYKKYSETDLALDEALVKPWKDAADEIAKFGGSKGALEAMNAWTAKGGAFDIFKNNATNQLKSPWTSGTQAVESFGSKVKSAMTTMYGNIKSNVTDAVKELNKLKVEIGKVNDTKIKTPSGGNGNANSGGNDSDNDENLDSDGRAKETDSKCNMSSADVFRLQEILNKVFFAGLKRDGVYGPATIEAVKQAQKQMGLTADGKYGQRTRNALSTYLGRLIKLSKDEGEDTRVYKNMQSNLPRTYYAKGTMGTKKNEWAITDEPWLGDELVLVPTAQGNLSYMRKGTSVVPASITENLVEWGKLNPHMMSAGVTGTNINIISNAVNKPEFRIDVENFLRCDNVSQDSLPELKRFVNEQMNNLMRQMNYSIKRFSR